MTFPSPTPTIPNPRSTTNRTRTTTTEVRVVIGLGANLSHRHLRFETAARILGLLVRDLRRSSIYRSSPQGFADQPQFWNAAVAGWTLLGPIGLARNLFQIEVALGRRPRFENGPREIDLDILLLGSACIRLADLVIPHRRLLERPFALVPAAEVAGDLVHPVARRPLASLIPPLTAPTELARIASPDDWAGAETSGPAVLSS